MASRVSTLAKLTPPRLYAVLPRERLFHRIAEQCRRHSMLWVAGPPGAGKTSLIASYLQKRKPRTLWYHLDPGDADLATFFHYVAKAAENAAGRTRLKLPALTPEFMADVPGFTRRFFRELWSKVPSPGVLVLDNYQEVPANALLHQILPVALSEFPAATSLIAISREQPPQQFAREVTHNLMGHITWEELRLTHEETASLASSTRDAAPEAIQALHAKANGWVAGTVLMLERLKVKSGWNTSLHSDTMTATAFHYFAEQVFARASAPVQEVLMRTALLPWVTIKMAAEVSENPSAYYVLRNFYTRGLFVDRRADELVSYQYHDLFREFLLDRSRTVYSEERLTELKRLAAGVAEQGGQLDAAARLYADTKSWDSLSQLICGVSEQLLAQGRNQTLRGYLELLPAAEVENRPWLLYWSGISRVVFDPIGARKDLEQAYQQFDAAQQDIDGLLLSCGGIIQSYFCCGDGMAPTIGWGDRIQQLLQRHKGWPRPEIQARVFSNLQGLMFACPHHSLFVEQEAGLDQFLHSLNDPIARLGVALTFMNVFGWRGESLRLGQMLDNLAVWTRGITVPPVQLLTWRIMEANLAWRNGDRDEAGLKIHEAHHIADMHGIVVLKSMVRWYELYHAVGDGDDREGERVANLLLAERHFHPRLTLAVCSFQRAGLALMKGDISTAYKHALFAVETVAPLNVPFIAGHCRLGLAKVLIELGEPVAAREHLKNVIDSARLMCSLWVEAHCLMTLADSYLLERNVEMANAYLREGLEIGRRNNYFILDYWWRPKVMATLLARALEADIEVDYVSSVIKRRQLVSPSPDIDAWPWPIRVSTLGRFELTIDDGSVTHSGKAQRKPLELLQILCAAGEQGVHQQPIQEILWPEADGVAADQAFRTTLHRLRKLLRHDDAVQLMDGHLSLNASLVRVDSVVFERKVQQVDRNDATALENLCRTYRGHFLPGETAAWALPVRERLRARYLTLIERLGGLLEEREELQQAAQKYLQALEVEPVAEVMCRRVMMTYVRLGRRTEAIGVYQRFTLALNKKLGVPPTPETVALYHNIARN